MRVIAGEVKGRRLKTPKNNRIRPTEDRIKENIFNILFGPFSGTVVLDLFFGFCHNFLKKEVAFLFNVYIIGGAKKKTRKKEKYFFTNINNSNRVQRFQTKFHRFSRIF